MGACLSVNKLENYPYGVYNVQPQLNSETIIEGSPDKAWIKIADTLCADSNYQYLTIGNFFPDVETAHRLDANGLDYAFYLIDDVRLTDVGAYYDNGKIAENSFRFDNIQFDHNRSALTSEATATLAQLVRFLKENPNARLGIEGHTDQVGELKYNQVLSLERANTVRKYLVGKGIAEERLAVSAKGATTPISTDNSERGRQLNRRVSFRITN